ncbi:DMT family transporter [Streptomyces fuscichromogenes]|uniref:DMT family transporter n=1 Tax=Streptomyces fuscichromogenes TaxID=1324013 RepID=UPI00382796F3
MAWLVLITSGILEAVWATAIGDAKGFSRPAPTLIFVVASLLSMGGLAYAMTVLSVGTAYAVWVGTGSVLTAAVAVARGREVLTTRKAALLVGLIGCVIGLKAVA